MDRQTALNHLESGKIDKETLLVILRTNYDDPDDDHRYADQALLAYINNVEITTAFNNIKKWYA